MCVLGSSYVNECIAGITGTEAEAKTRENVSGFMVAGKVGGVLDPIIHTL